MLILYFVLTGIVLLIVSAFLYFQIFILNKNRPTRVWWLVMLILIISFIGGYFVYGWRFIQTATSTRVDVIVSQVLFWGAIFVFLSSLLGYITIRQIHRRNVELRKVKAELKEYSVGLENLVSKRTEKLKTSYKEAVKKEKKIQRLKDDFLFVAAHELKSPVTSIKWNFEILDDISEFKKLPKKVAEPLSAVRDANTNLIKLVNDLLNIARVEHGTISVEIKSVSVPALVKDVVKQLSHLAEQEGVIIKNLIPDSLPKVKIDEKRLAEVFTNILSNAIKYNKKNGTVEIGVKRNNGSAIFVISDTGLGMEKDELRNVFKKFYRSSEVKDRGIEGTGLGLFISKQMIDMMKGGIWAKSEGRDKGSSFYIELPLAKK